MKQPQRRGRPQPSKSSPASTVDLNAIATASENIQRTSSPQALSPASTPVQPPQRSSSAMAAPVASGFDDDAWTPRPSSTKPLTPTPSAPAARAPSAPPAPPPAPAPAVSPPQSQPPPAAPPVQNQTSGSKLANTTESDIFDQLSRLSQLRVQSPAASPAAPSPPVNAASPPVASPPPASYQAGLGMGSSPVPMGQHVQNQQTGLLTPQNGPRGPYAPVPSNQSLLQPLIPTTTGFNNFVPTRPGNAGQSPQSFMPPQVTGFPNNPQPMMSQPTGFTPTMPMMPQQTGMPAGNFGNFGVSPFQNNGNFGGVQTSKTIKIIA